jgi:hypothetical protein
VTYPRAQYEKIETEIMRVSNDLEIVDGKEKKRLRR